MAQRRYLFCGDREWRYWRVMGDVIRENLEPGDVIIEGEAPGADQMARDIGTTARMEVLRFPADWKKHGRAAGPIRNAQMLEEGRPDEVFAFHDNIHASKGTRDMIKKSKKKGIPVRLFTQWGEVPVPEDL